MKSFVWIIVLIVACIFLWNVSPWVVIIVGVGIVTWIIFLITKKPKVSNQAHTDSVRNPPSTQRVDPRPRQYDETLTILKDTTNCETFFSRMDFAYSIANETHNQNWLDYLNTNADKLTRDFINRAASHEQGILSRMKT